MIILDTTCEQFGPEPRSMQTPWGPNPRFATEAASLRKAGLAFVLLLMCAECRGIDERAYLLGSDPHGPLIYAHYAICKGCGRATKAVDGDFDKADKWIKELNK